MSTDELMQDAVDAHHAWEDADRAARDAGEVRAEKIRAALDAGCGATTLARTLGISRGRLYQIAAQ